MTNSIKLGLEVARLHRIIDREVDRNIMNIVQKDLSVSQARIILFLADEGQGRSVYQKDIEQEFALKGPSVSLAISNMEQKGYVIRQQSPQDGRYRRIVLTEKSMNLYHKIVTALVNTDHAFAQDISEEEMYIFLTVAGKVRSRIGE